MTDRDTPTPKAEGGASAAKGEVTKGEIDAVIKALEIPYPWAQWEGDCRGSHVDARKAAKDLIERLAALQPSSAADAKPMAWRDMADAPTDASPILIRRATPFPSEEGFHVVRWDDVGDGWVVHDGKTDHPLRGPEPEAWMPLDYEDAQPHPSQQGGTEGVGFLLERLTDFQNGLGDSAEMIVRDWHGHVEPAIARVLAALKTSEARG